MAVGAPLRVSSNSKFCSTSAVTVQAEERRVLVSKHEKHFRSFPLLHPSPSDLKQCLIDMTKRFARAAARACLTAAAAARTPPLAGSARLPRH